MLHSWQLICVFRTKLYYLLSINSAPRSERRRHVRFADESRQDDSSKILQNVCFTLENQESNDHES